MFVSREVVVLPALVSGITDTPPPRVARWIRRHSALLAPRRRCGVEYLNRACLESLSAKAFAGRQPYPWVEMENSLTPDGYEQLRAALPPVEAGFAKQVGVHRAYGQAPHDRYLLHYRPGVQVAPVWEEF